MKKIRDRYLPLMILAAALVSCLYGALGGEAGIVLRKAAAVCMECIGIG